MGTWQYHFDLAGNLIRRQDWRRNNQIETFTYDNLDRLKTSVLGGSTQTLSLHYDAIGNLCSKSVNGAVNAYSYGPAAGCAGPTGSGSPHQVKSAYGQTHLYDANGDLATRIGGSGGDLGIEYDGLRQARELYKSTSLQVIAGSTFLYGPDGARYKRQDRVSGGAISRTVRYVGALEREEFPSGQRRIRHTIGGFLLLNREFANSSSGTQPALFHNYVYTDHLGSTDVIVSSNGTVVEDLSFDPHGSRRIPGNWTQPLASYIPTTTLRGYTGHEHLDDLGLIHMNARIYDPRLGRFLQADSEIEPDATQGLNRYTYVLHNPLSASDPTGHRSEWVDAAKGIAAIAVSVFLPQTGWIFAKETFGAYVFAGFIGGSISGGLQGGLWGAFSASVFYGIGNSFTPYQKAARGIKQGGLNSQVHQFESFCPDVTSVRGYARSGPLRGPPTARSAAPEGAWRVATA